MSASVPYTGGSSAQRLARVQRMIKNQWAQNAALSLVLALAMWLPLAGQADFGAYIRAPAGQEWVRLASFGWENPLKPSTGPETFDETAFLNGRIAPKQGPATLVISKPVSKSINGLSEYCGAQQTLPVVHVDMPVWDTRMPTDELYFQHYALEQVTVQKCQHTDGAPADAIWLEFATITAEGEPRPRKQ